MPTLKLFPSGNDLEKKSSKEFKGQKQVAYRRRSCDTNVSNNDIMLLRYKNTDAE